MTLIADHHLLPLRADWSETPLFRLSWDTEVDASLRGYEARAAKRQWPRPELRLRLTITDAVALTDLRSRLVAALRVDHDVPANTDGRTGRVCIPFAGRESWVSLWGGATTLYLEGGHWPWKAGDWLIGFTADETSFEVAQVSEVVGDPTVGQTLTLAIGISEAAAAGPVTPLFFGRIAELPLELQLDNPIIGSLSLRVLGESYEIDESAWPIGGGDSDEPPALPSASFTASVTDCREISCDAGDSTVGVGLTIAGYEWDFGDGDKEEGNPIAHTYRRAGTYIVTLTVRDSRGRRSADARNVTVLACEGDPDDDDNPPEPPDEPEDPADPAPVDPEEEPDPPEDYPPPGATTGSGDPILPPSFGA